MISLALVNVSKTNFNLDRAGDDLNVENKKVDLTARIYLYKYKRKVKPKGKSLVTYMKH